MFLHRICSNAALLLACVPLIFASLGPQFHADSQNVRIKRQYFPKKVETKYQFTTKQGVTIRYNTPGKDGVCETTPGVNSYSGYIDLSPNVHIFFWFFDSRSNPATDDFTLWLNGGPGSDSLIGLFEELGPCRITESLDSVLNPYSFNNASNMLFLSQPVGTGFSNQGIQNGSYGEYTGTFLNASQANVTGTWPILDPIDVGEIDTTDLAAMAAWHVLQGFLEGLPYLTGNAATSPKNFNLWTESYGGHYGPAFYDYFYKQNALIQSGTQAGYPLNFKTLGIINGIISEIVQGEHYPEFAVNNTYGIKAYNDTVYNYARFANFMIGGCQAQIQGCIAAANDINGGYVKGKITNVATRNPSIAAVCAEAADMCRDNVESPYYNYGGRGAYDIRHPLDDPTPESYFEDYLNQEHIQEAIGVSINYTDANNDIYWQFQQTGDFVYPNFLQDLEEILASGVRVSLIYGDADYICNWFGGQAVSLAVNYTHKAQFAAAGYQPLIYGGVEYGETREYGNFSFTRVYESGHEVPYYQPQAAFALFNRSIHLVDLPTGLKPVTPSLASNGTANATHTNSYATFPPETASSAFASYSSSLIASYASQDNLPPPKVTPA